MSRFAQIIGMLLILSACGAATASETDSRKYSVAKISLRAETRLRFTSSILDLEQDYNLLDHLTMYEPAPGELQIRYRGALAPIVKHIRGRFRRLCDNALRDQMEFMSDCEVRRLNEARANAWHDLDSGGRWWERSWRQSLPVAKGGATRRTQYDGTDNSWRIWHVTVTNSLKEKFDYAALLELDTDSTTDVDPMFFRSSAKQRVTVDISTPAASDSHIFRVRFSPKLSIGLPDKNDVIVRSVSIRANIDVFTNPNRRFVAAEVELGVRDHDDVFCSLNAALVSW